MQKFDIVYIKWEDAISGSSEWQSLADANDWDDECVSFGHHVGILLTETDDHVLLVSDMMPHTKDGNLADTNCFSPFRIPKSWILQREVLGTLNLAKGFKIVKH